MLFGYSCFFVLLLLQQLCGGLSTNDTAQQPRNLPGISVRITQKALDYGIEKILQVVETMLTNLSIPDVEHSVMAMTIKLSGINLSMHNRPELKSVFIENLERTHKDESNQTNSSTTTVSSTADDLDDWDDWDDWGADDTDAQSTAQTDSGTHWHNEAINPGGTNEGFGGLRFELSRVNLDIEANLQVKVSLIFSTMTSESSITLTINNASMNLTAFVGEENGDLKLASLACKANGQLNIFSGGLESLKIISSFINIESFLFAELCDNVVNYIKTSMDTQLPERMTSIVEFAPYLSFEFGLTEVPLFTKNFVETRHKGAFQPTGNFQNWTFSSKRMEFLNNSSKMGYMIISDYTLNTLWHSEQKAVKPPRTQIVEHEGNNYTVHVIMHTLPQEVFNLHGKQLKMTAIAELFMYRDQQEQKCMELLTLQRDVLCEIELAVVGSKVVYHINEFSVTASVTDQPATAELNSEDESIIELATNLFRHTLEEDFGKNGISLPETPEFRFDGLTILDAAYPGYLILASDFEFKLDHLSGMSASLLDRGGSKPE